MRDLAAHTERDLIEINFERDPSWARYFAASDPTRVLADLSLAYGERPLAGPEPPLPR